VFIETPDKKEKKLKEKYETIDTKIRGLNTFL